MVKMTDRNFLKEHINLIKDLKTGNTQKQLEEQKEELKKQVKKIGFPKIISALRGLKDENNIG
jgi:hypothetical protein